MAFGGSEGLAPPPGDRPELDLWFAQILAELKEVFEDIDTHTHPESDITDGSILARLAADETVTGAWTFSNLLTLNSSGEMLRLDDSSATGNPFLSFYQAGTQRAYIQYLDGNPDFRLVVQEGNALIWRRDGGDEILRLRHETTTGSPYLSFYQGGTRRAFIQWDDANESLELVAEGTASRITAYVNDGIGTTNAIAHFKTAAGGPGLEINPEALTFDEILRLKGGATGNPYISFYQSGTRKGFIQYLDSGDDLRFNNEGGGGFHLLSSNSEILRLRHSSDTGSPFLSFYQAGTERARIQFIDGSNRFRLLNWTGGPIEVSATADHVFKIQHTISTGNPFLSFYQAGTRRAYIQYVDGDDSFRFQHDGPAGGPTYISSAGGNIGFYNDRGLASTARLMLLDGSTKDATFEGDVYADGGATLLSGATVLTGSKVWDPAGFTDHSSQSTTITVTGAVVGDGVMVNNPFSGGFGDYLIAYGQVISPDTVEYVLHNASTNVPNPSSQTIRAMVVQA